MRYLPFVLLLISLPAVAQKQKHSNAYLSIMMHDTEPGLSVVNSWGIGKYIGIGAGVDITGYNSELFIPVYLDLRLTYPIQERYIPFILGQFGKHLYQKKDAISYLTADQQRISVDEIGRYFFSGGAGFHFKIGKVGIFASYMYRHAEFRNKANRPIEPDVYPDFSKGFHVVNLGVTL